MWRTTATNLVLGGEARVMTTSALVVPDSAKPGPAGGDSRDMAIGSAQLPSLELSADSREHHNVRCIDANEAMIRHAMRLGRQAEGRIRRHVSTNGRYFDEVILGLTREESDDSQTLQVS